MTHPTLSFLSNFLEALKTSHTILIDGARQEIEIANDFLQTHITHLSNLLAKPSVSPISLFKQIPNFLAVTLETGINTAVRQTTVFSKASDPLITALKTTS